MGKQRYLNNTEPVELEGSDIQIGAVELKDGVTDNRAQVDSNGNQFTVPRDPDTGNTLEINSDGSIIIDSITNPVDTNATVVNTPNVKIEGDVGGNVAIVDSTQRLFVAPDSFNIRQIFAGKVFYIAGFDMLDNGNVLDFGVTVSESIPIGLVFQVGTTGAMDLFIYEDSEFSGGTNVPLEQQNRNSLVAPATLATQNPTVTVIGTQIGSQFIGSGSKNNAVGGGAGTFFPLLLKQNTKYVFRFTSGSNSNTLSFAATFAENF